MAEPNLRPHARAASGVSRSRNRHLVLQLIAERTTLSRADLVRSTGLSRATVSEIVAVLLDEGLLTESGPGASTGGKPPTLLEIDPEGRFVIAVDMARTPFQAARFDLGGTVGSRLSGRGDPLQGRAALDDLHRLIGGLLGASHAPPLGVGVSIPGGIDESGIVVAPTLQWDDVDLRVELEDVYGLPAQVWSDVDSGAVAEFAAGDFEPTSSMLYVSVGSRIATAVILEGRLFPSGRHGGDITGLVRSGRSLAATLAPIVGSLGIGHVVVAGGSVSVADLAASWHRLLGWPVTVSGATVGSDAGLRGAAAAVLSSELGIVWVKKATPS